MVRRLASEFTCSIFVFSVVGEDCCSCEKVSYLLAIIKCPEKDKDIKNALQATVSEINDINFIFVGEKNIYKEFFLTGDMKFLNLAMGLDSCSSVYSYV